MTALGSNGANALIAVFNLNNPALKATPDLTGWMAQSNPPVDYITTNPLFNAARSFMLNVGIGAGATRGDYGISAILAGGKGTSTRWSTTRDLTLRIVPEPAAAALLCCGLAATALYARRRRFGTAKT